MRTTCRIFLLGFLCLFGFNALSQENNVPDENSPRVYRTMRLTTGKPVIDGVLNDDCWKTGTWSGDYVQWVPKEGAVPSSPTELKILYDDKNIYVAIRAFDGEAGKISKKAGRRDEFIGDVVGINFDSYHDHRTGFEFNVTAYGQKIDLIVTNPMNGDHNWNAVWTCKTGMEDSAWVAEYEIPLSQLRYSSEPEQTWGLHAWRWIERFAEESDWEPQTSTGPGMLYLFGHLEGIKDLPKSRRIEVMPYALGKLKTFEKQIGNPFAADGNSWDGSIGLDAKIGLSSNFTADVTINPDFGQVEADPSVMNLTAFETFFDEKRPFFLEGKNIFQYDFDDVNLFYTRRIGHSPSYYPGLADGQYIDFPENTSILSAVKVSGKTSDGLSVGLMQSITNKEQAEMYSDGNVSKTSVEPLTSYTVARVQQDFNEGTTVLGGIVTSTNRFLNEDKFDFLPENSFTGGIDFLHQWHDKEFYLDARLIGSTINGDAQAISRIQQSSAHFFQRPDADHLEFDPGSTSLSGQGGRIRIGKGSKGLWRYSTGVSWRSPGLELNDLGFMHMADVFNVENKLSYFVNQPVSIFRTYYVDFSQQSNWDYGMNYLSTKLNLSTGFEFLNKWGISPWAEHTGEALDNHILRGGYAMKIPAVTKVGCYVHTDYAKKLGFGFSSSTEWAADKVYKNNFFSPSITYQPVNTLRFSVGVEYSKNGNELQYVSTPAINSESRYILGMIDQKTVGATFRIDYNITPELSIQYYGSPFASVGKYSNFKSVINPTANKYGDRFELLNPVTQDNSYVVSEAGNGTYSFGNPDFSFSQFRSNMVFHWEYNPGSHLYFVWSNERTHFENTSSGTLNSAMRNLGDVFPKNLFLVKLSYWFSI